MIVINENVEDFMNNNDVKWIMQMLKKMNDV